jgi:hypothetical protein
VKALSALISKMFSRQCSDGQSAKMDWLCFGSAEALNFVPSLAFLLLGLGLESRGLYLPGFISLTFSAFLVAWPVYFCQQCVP